MPNLTDAYVKNLKPADKRKDYRDDSLHGFSVRVSQGGTKTFALVHGRSRSRTTLGRYPVISLAQARAKAKEILAQKTLGLDKQATSTTYQTALDAFLEASGERCKPRTVRDYKRLLTRYGFGLEKLDEIAPRDIQRKLDRITAQSERSHAHVALAILFRFAMRRHYLDRNPMERMDRPAKQGTRFRILTDDELSAVWNASEGMFGTIIKLCILTGQRSREIAQLTRSMIEGTMVRLPPELTKNSREHLFPIGPMTSEILSTLPGSGYLFPARKDWSRGKKATVYHAWNKDKAKLDKASGVTGWVIHDLRRTFVSSWASLSIRLEVTEKYVNHISGSTGGLVGIYNRFDYAQPMRDALKLWEKHLISIVARVTLTEPSMASNAGVVDEVHTLENS